jgi:hypothetical protein
MSSVVEEVVQSARNPFVLPPTYVMEMLGDYFIEKATEETSTHDDAMRLAAKQTVEFAIQGGYGA